MLTFLPRKRPYYLAGFRPYFSILSATTLDLKKPTRQQGVSFKVPRRTGQAKITSHFSSAPARKSPPMPLNQTRGLSGKAQAMAALIIKLAFPGVLTRWSRNYPIPYALPTA